MDLLKEVGPVITAIGICIATIIGSIAKWLSPAITRLAKATESQTAELTKIGIALAVQNERIEANQKTTEHNFRQIRAALEGLTQRPACEFDPTSATEVHEAAQKQLRARAT